MEIDDIALHDYHFGYKFEDCENPPPIKLPHEPRLYLYISVKHSELEETMTICYARSRTNLMNGFPSTQEDRNDLMNIVKSRLSIDAVQLLAGDLQISREKPMYV